MATYAIGDIQGCHDELMRLLEAIAFDPGNDTLWLTGDLVNRGPASLAVLEFVHGLGDAAVVVLGNHDLHLLVCALTDTYSPGKKDTFQDVIDSGDAPVLYDWLRRCPLLHRDRNLGFTMVHAGLPPLWSLDAAATYADEVATVLRGDEHSAFLERMYGNDPNVWDASLAGWDRLRVITNYLTRLRYTSRQGQIDFKYKGPVGSQSAGLVPWYEVYDHLPADEHIVFGHWSALHLSEADMHRKRMYALDTGAVWGGTLTALRLEDKRLFSVPSGIALPVVD